jgi:MinD superfamily P-loop ATPase
MTTQYITDPTLTDLVIALVGPGVDVRIVEIDQEQCEWCGDVDAVTTVRVYGQPRPEVLLPVECEQVCGTCAIPLIQRAKSEARDDAGDIVIEVAA